MYFSILGLYLSPLTSHLNGTTAILTRTNEETLQVAYELEQQGIHATVAQSMGGFRFGNLAEVRYFLKQLDYLSTQHPNNTSNLSPLTFQLSHWQEAKRRTLEKYATSKCLDVMRHFFADFEATHKVFYRSDLQEFVFESNIEDFIAADGKSVFVSTIHKAKGREFDTVYLMSQVPDETHVEDMRSYYVGLTRAKRNLYLLLNPSTQSSSVSIALTLHDVWLDFCKPRKDIILQLRSGDMLTYRDGFLFNGQDLCVAALSAMGKEKLKAWEDKGYTVSNAEVSYTLAWRPKDVDIDYAVCLANVVLKKPRKDSDNQTKR